MLQSIVSHLCWWMFDTVVDFVISVEPYLVSSVFVCEVTDMWMDQFPVMLCKSMAVYIMRILPTMLRLQIAAGGSCVQIFAYRYFRKLTCLRSEVTVVIPHTRAFFRFLCGTMSWMQLSFCHIPAQRIHNFIAICGSQNCENFCPPHFLPDCRKRW